ncbi:transposase, IS91 family, putative [Sorangium cellulosum So ce56]|uniref:Transposase, IS91 family, putative n=2 Tax=Sorangium cellulosum TaxID=56 RepID=A9G7I2_SORC5|nr:transposase, IS91 family, putative [Sorangium cellulosum So ce56]
MVLHTWTRDLRFHPHIHAIVTGGGLSLDGTRWIPTRPDYFMPVKQLGAVFRDHFIQRLCALWRKGVFDGFEVPGGLDRLLGLVSKKSWVVYAKRPFGEARHVLRYLGRYTHRVGISNQRMVSMSDDGLVTFRTKDGKMVTLAGEAFLGRFVEHVLPRQYVKIRHIGLMAASNVSTKLARARELLTGPMPAPAPARNGDDMDRRAARDCRHRRAPLPCLRRRHRTPPAAGRQAATPAARHLMTRRDPKLADVPGDAIDATVQQCAGRGDLSDREQAQRPLRPRCEPPEQVLGARRGPRTELKHSSCTSRTPAATSTSA